MNPKRVGRAGNLQEPPKEATPESEPPKDVPGPTPEEIRHRRSAYLRQIADSQQGIYQRAWSAKGLPNMIRAKCLDCCCGDRAEAAGCPCCECPLWERNPYRTRVKR